MIHDWRLLKAFLCLPVTVGSVDLTVMIPDWESVGCEFKYSTGLFSFSKEMPSLVSLILNTKTRLLSTADGYTAVLKLSTES